MNCGSICLAFQSLLSQGISLLLGLKASGVCGKINSFNPFLVRASVYCLGVKPPETFEFPEFQSLLSQGISLLSGRARPRRRRSRPRGFNPFLVRASVYCERHPRRPFGPRYVHGFNPFLVRASVYCQQGDDPGRGNEAVSIPS